MEKHTCKLCFRSFGNGRALGGHMRSHVAASNKAAAVQLIRDSSPSPLSESSSSSRDYDDDVDPKGTGMVMGPLGYGLRENPKRSFRLVDPEFSSTFPAVDASSYSAAIAAAGSSVVVQDRESETESSRAPTTTQRRRSKRARTAAAAQPDPPPAAAPEPEPVSSVSDTTTEEDVAISLMMLSRDFWGPMTKSDDQQSEQNNHRFFEDDVEEEGEDEIDIDASQTRKNHHHHHHHHHPVKGRSKYQCGTCKKVFRSYQALGGHRASHKKNNGCVPPAATPVKASAQIHIHEVDSSVSNVERAQHECPVCFRVFSSGQALGGHKRSHLTSTSAATITITSSSIPVAAAAAQFPVAAAGPTIAKHVESLIDLNLPAPMEDDAELSAVSDAEFVMARSSN